VKGERLKSVNDQDMKKKLNGEGGWGKKGAALRGEPRHSEIDGAPHVLLLLRLLLPPSLGRNEGDAELDAKGFEVEVCELSRGEEPSSPLHRLLSSREVRGKRIITSP